jgi:hypothetical protein
MFEPLRLLPLHALAGTRPRGHALLGMRYDGRPATLDITHSASRHLNIQGARGSGKSELLRTIVASLCLRHSPAELGCLVVDPGGRELAALSALPHAVGSPLAEVPSDQLLEKLDRSLEILVAVDGTPSPRMQDRIAQFLSPEWPNLHLLIVGDWIEVPGARLRAESKGIFAMDSEVRFQAAFLPAADLNLLIKLLRARRRRTSAPNQVSIPVLMERVALAEYQ